MADYRKIPKLKGAENYEEWKRYIKATFILNDVYDVVCTEWQPENPFPKDDQLQKLPKRSPEDKAKIKEYYVWKSKNNDALSGMRISINKKCRSRISSVQSAYEAYAELKRQYEQEPFAAMHAVFSELIHINSKDFKDFHQYRERFNVLKNRLAALNEPLSNNHLVALFTKGLPKDMDIFVYTITEVHRRKGEQVDIDYLTRSLADIEMMRSART